VKHSKAKLSLLVSGALLALGALGLAGLVWFGVPSRVPYNYIDLNTPGVSVRERYRPPQSLYLGEEIPRVYEASLGTETLLIHDPEEAQYRYVPALEIAVGPSQRVAVNGLDPSCTHLFRKSEREIVIWWGACADIGDTVGFVVRLGTGATLAVRGTVRSAGTFTAWDVL
jgi:hypothetical protein